MINVPIYNQDDAELVLKVVKQLVSSGYALPSQVNGAPRIVPKPIYCTNESGEEIPAYSVMQIVGVEEIGGQNYIKVDQFDETKFGEILFNGHRAIETGGSGIAQPGPVYLVQGDGSTATEGRLWGPVTATWTITDNDGPYVMLGEDDIETDVVKVMKASTDGWWFKAPAGGIPARSGTTPGSASCTPYVIGNSGDFIELKDGSGASMTMTVYHGGQEAVSGDAYIQASHNHYKLSTHMEDCPA